MNTTLEEEPRTPAPALAAPATLPLAAIVAARQRLNGAIAQTPCSESAALSEITGSRVFCKREYLQRTGSFKERGARNALARLPRGVGVIAASAGNHALGLAWHGRDLGIPVTVVMPRFAPLVKVATCRSFGAEVILHGETFEEARLHADTVQQERALHYIHPFDDWDVIAGQGTLALELIDQVPELDAIVVPIGGGGLLAGVITVLRTLKPEVEIIGVEPENAACYTAALEAGGPTAIATRYTLADGLAVSKAGERPYPIIAGGVDRVVTVGENDIALAILRLAEREKAVVEGAGATPLAALLSGALPELKGKRVVLPLTGGNIDALAHSRVIERGLAADGRIYRFTVYLNDRPGGLARLATLLAEAGANVTEIVHNRTFAGPDLSNVHVLCTVETRDRDHIAEITGRLETNGLQCVPA